MSFEAATQRMAELQVLTGVQAPPATQAISPALEPGENPFAASLMQAQAGIGMAGAPDSSQASGVPMFAAMTSQSGASALQGAYGSYAPVGPMGLQAFGYGGAGERIVALAQSQIGVQESPPGSNDSQQIRTYRTATSGAENTPGPWCAYFVSWLAQQAGAPVGAEGTGLGYVPNLESWARGAGRWVDPAAGARAGDIVIFDRNGDGLADHTGVVERTDAQGIHTIEGNTSDGVARRSYAATSSQVRGLIRAG